MVEATKGWANSLARGLRTCWIERASSLLHCSVDSLAQRAADTTWGLFSRGMTAWGKGTRAYASFEAKAKELSRRRPKAIIGSNRSSAASIS